MSDEIKITNKQILYTKAKSSELGKLVGEIVRNGYSKDLATVKKYLLSKGNRTKIDARIVTTVLQARQEGEKIILKDNTFSKPLVYYMSYGPIQTNCLSNDQLYLLMLSRKVQAALKTTAKTEKFLSGCILKNVTFISQNFSGNVPTYKGFFQDYDPMFSAICNSENRTVEVVDDIIARKPSLSNMDFFGTEYKFFGDERLCIICPDDMQDLEIKNKAMEMKYLYNEKSAFALGEKTIEADTKIKYLYKTVSPEGFCPSFWFNTGAVNCNLLFEYSMDYNSLFDYLISDLNRDNLEFPKNMCYWDTFQQAMDFLGVFALTNYSITEENKDRILEWLGDYADIKSYFNKWKENQLKMERIFHDFLNGFLNNSDLTRFTNLLQKTVACVDTYKALMNEKEDYQDFMRFMASLPFCQMMNNQLRNEVYNILVSIGKVLKNYIRGITPDSIVNDVRGVAKSIFELLPGADIDKAAFPFICPGGNIVGDLIKFNENKADPLKRNINNAVKRVYALRSRENQRKKEEVEAMKRRDETIKTYAMDYMVGRQKRSPLYDKRLEREALAGIFLYYINAFATQDEKDEAISMATGEKRKKIYPLLDTFMKDYATWRDVSKKKKKISQTVAKTLSAYFDNMANMNDVEIEEDKKMEVEEDAK